MQASRVNASDSQGLDRLINTLLDSSTDSPQGRAVGAPAEGVRGISTALEDIRKDAEARQ